MSEGTLLGHVATERSMRFAKAAKIEALLPVPLVSKDVLDLGTGSGVLAQYFRDRGARVTAADRELDKFDAPGIEPVFIRDGALPFEDRSFDIVVLNHVIEHVGPRHDQIAMLREIRRCLRPGGTLYLAVPNRWALIEPHYKIPLLGALPRRVANALVKATGKHSHYDCFPFDEGELRAILAEIFDSVRNVSADAFYHVARNELGGVMGGALAKFPHWLAQSGEALFPTLIFIATKPENCGTDG